MTTNKYLRNARTRKEREVWEACEQIKIQQRPITYFAIGEQLVQMGFKRGSNSDIRRYLKTWRKNQVKDVKEDRAVTPREPINRLNIHPSNAKEDSPMHQVLKIYEHHVEQFDRLFKIIDLLKAENKKLKDKINALTVQNAKPRMIYRPW